MWAPVTSIGQRLLGKEESEAVRNRLVTGAAGLLGLRITFSGLSFLVTLLLARLLGPEAFGAYSYALAWIVLIGIPPILGMDQALCREVAACLAKSQWGRMHTLLRKAHSAVLLASLSVALIAGVVAWLLRGRLPAGMLPTFFVALPLLPLITLTRVRQGALQGLHRVALGALPEQLVQPVLMLLMLSSAGLLMQQRLSGALAMGMNAIAAAVAFALGAWLLHRTLPRGVREAALVDAGFDWARSSLPLIFLASSNVLFAQADTLILGAVRGTAAVGIYSVAHKGADLMTFVLMAQNAAFASTASSLYASGDLDRLQRLVTRLARWTVLFSMPIALVLIVFGGWFLGLYGPQFGEARLSLAILSAGQIFNIGMGSVGLLLTMTGHERQAAKAVASAAAANILLTAALAPRWGAEGAAVAYACSMILWNVAMAVSLYRKVGIHSTALGKLSF